MSLRDTIADRQAVVAIAGLGYVGLALAVAFAEAGFVVRGIDTAPEKVRLLNAGRSPVHDVPSETIEKLAGGRNARLTVGDDYDVVNQADVAIVCVPTPLNKTREPDISHIIATVDALSPRLHADMLVVVESTSYPGSTQELVLPRLLAGTPKPLAIGRNFFVAFSPERLDPGQQRWNLANTPKVLGGITAECTHVATVLYSAIVEKVIPVSSSRTAEMVKLLENTFRAVNIGLANETALICNRLGIDVWEVIESASTKPFGYMPFYPGPGLGGHCIPVDPRYLAWRLKSLDYTARFIQCAEEVNGSMPRYVLERISDALNDEAKALRGSQVLILGVAYKPDVNDARESPALALIRLLMQKGAAVMYHDPFVPDLREDGLDMHSLETPGQPELDDALAAADCVVIVANHSAYDWDTIVQNSRKIVDTRNATKGVTSNAGKVTKI